MDMEYYAHDVNLEDLNEASEGQSPTWDFRLIHLEARPRTSGP